MNNVESATQFIKILTNISFNDILKLNNIQKVVVFFMGKMKIALRTIWNIVVCIFIYLLFVVTMDATDIVLTAMFSTFLFPATILLLIYHIYTSVMYYVYCYKHRDDKICFTNKDKSKLKTIISTVILITVAVLFMLYAMSLVTSFGVPVTNDKIEEKLGFIDSEISDYSFVENLDVQTEKVMTTEHHYMFMSMYAAEGNLIVNETTTKEHVAKINFEYSEKLPWYISTFIYKDVVDRLDTSWSFRTDGVDYSTTHNETEIDGVKVVYRYIQCSEANFIDICMKKGNKILYIEENWEQFVDIDAESRIDEWIETFKNI